MSKRPLLFTMLSHGIMVRRCLFFLLFIGAGISYTRAQSSCAVGDARVIYVCAPNYPGEKNLPIGIQTIQGATYSWYKGATRIGGPLPGTGNAESIDFAVGSHTEAGHYTVERTQVGSPTVCMYNALVKYNEPVSPITITNITASSVSFSWTSQGKYEYEVIPVGYSFGQKGTTTGSSATVNLLSGGSNYYIRMVSVGDYTACSNDPGQTIDFTTLAGPCYAEIGSTQIFGAGNYCVGTTVALTLENSYVGQTYTWLRNGVPVSSAMAGTGGLLGYNFSYTAGAAGVYSVRVTKAGCTLREFGSATIGTLTGITGLTRTSLTEINASYSWNSSGPNFLSYDFAVTPGATPPTVDFNYTYGTSITVEAMPGTTNYFHVRNSGCASSPWTTVSFTTPALTPTDCSSNILTTCVNTHATIAAGGGNWNLAGAYPVNSTGVATPGKELVYRFTPATTGVYYIDIAGISGSVSYLYKPVAAGCNGNGWTAITSADASTNRKFSIGMLQGGTPYYILLDNELASAATHTFKVCMATVAAPALNTCVATSKLNNYIPANSPKEEYIVDNNGNLVASIDFSKVPRSVEGFGMSYYIHSGTIRKDEFGAEYLNRNYSLYANDPSYIYDTMTVKLFFLTTELQTLINEPDDGIADVTGIDGLNLSMQGSCTGYYAPGGMGVYSKQRSNGMYNGNAAYITANIMTWGNMNLHGDEIPLGYKINLYASEDFDATSIRGRWKQQQVSGTGNLTIESSKLNPLIVSYSGPRYVHFNASSLSAGSETRLISPPLITTGTTNVTTEFFWYVTNIAPYTTGGYLNEGVQVEYSLDGINWIAVGSLIPRHDGSVPAGTGQWKKKRINLPVGAGNQSHIFVSFKFRSAGGINCGFDIPVFIPTPPCTAEVTNVTITSTTNYSASFNWTAVAGSNRYEYLVTSTAAAPSYGYSTNATSATDDYLMYGTTYYLHVRSFCGSVSWGPWTTIKFKIADLCRNSIITFNGYNVTGAQSIRWQMDNGTGYTNLNNTGYYSGVTTQTLSINNPPGNFNGYKYRRQINYAGGNIVFDDPFELKIGSTWTGAMGTGWNTPGNWSCGIVPDANTDIIIPTGITNMPVISTNVSCRNLVVAPGVIITVNSPAKLTVTGTGQ